MLTLAFETSCDETSAAVLDNDTVLSNIVLSQMFHSEWGGVVPEIASREHLKSIVSITETALEKADVKLKDINLIAAANEPGLIGALLIGMSYAKMLAASLEVPFIPVNHIQAHLYSSFLEGEKPEFPFISLIVSGGHTLLVLVKDYFVHQVIGTTVDDAAGEAYDKVAKLLGLGYPGGPVIDKLARTGDRKFHKFPLANVKNSPFDFSFSGIKTSVLYFLRNIQEEKKKDEKFIADVCACFQEAVTESLMKKTISAARKFGVENIAVSGGVSANSELKSKFLKLRGKGYKIFIPSAEYTTDNGAMIGLTAYLKYMKSENKKYFLTDSFEVGAKARFTEL
jgi:N6-L-threonylcarbamoyladenine synthase